MIHLVWPITLISDSDTNILIIEEILCKTSSTILEQVLSYLFRQIIYQIMLINIGWWLSYLRNSIYMATNIHIQYHEGISDVSKCWHCSWMAYFCDVFRMNDGNRESTWKTKTSQFLTISVKQSPGRFFLILRTTFFLVWRKLLHQYSGYSLCDWRQNIWNKYRKIKIELHYFCDIT